MGRRNSVVPLKTWGALIVETNPLTAIILPRAIVGGLIKRYDVDTLKKLQPLMSLKHTAHDLTGFSENTQNTSS